MELWLPLGLQGPLTADLGGVGLLKTAILTGRVDILGVVINILGNEVGQKNPFPVISVVGSWAKRVVRRRRLPRGQRIKSVIFCARSGRAFVGLIRDPCMDVVLRPLHGRVPSSDCIV